MTLLLPRSGCADTDQHDVALDQLLYFGIWRIEHLPRGEGALGHITGIVQPYLALIVGRNHDVPDLDVREERLVRAGTT